jgi:hypothetical protein
MLIKIKLSSSTHASLYLLLLVGGRQLARTCTRGHACVFSPLHHRTRVGVRICACIDRCMHACATLHATHPLPYRPFLEIKPSDLTLTNCAAALAVCMRAFLALSCMQLPNTIRSARESRRNNDDYWSSFVMHHVTNVRVL